MKNSHQPSQFPSLFQSNLSDLRRDENEPPEAHREPSREDKKLLLRHLRLRGLQQENFRASRSSALSRTSEVLEMRFCGRDGEAFAIARQCQAQSTEENAEEPSVLGVRANLQVHQQLERARSEEASDGQRLRVRRVRQTFLRSIRTQVCS